MVRDLTLTIDLQVRPDGQVTRAMVYDGDDQLHHPPDRLDRQFKALMAAVLAEVERAGMTAELERDDEEFEAWLSGLRTDTAYEALPIGSLLKGGQAK